MIPLARPWVGDAELEAVAEVVKLGRMSSGPCVERFEAAVCERFDVAHAVAVQSCTAGLHVALAILGVGPGDEVVVPSLSFIATANAVRYVGADPVFAEVDRTTQNVTPDTVARRIGPRTRAVMIVHQSGLPADIDAIRAVCDEAGVPLIEDAACAAASTYKGAAVNGAGGIAVFSFHPRKTLTTGEGGVITTNDADLAAKARRAIAGARSIYASADGAAQEPGLDCTMTEVQAALGIVQLGRLTEIVERRRRMASRYQELLADVPGMVTIADPPWGTTNYQSFWVTLPDEIAATRTEVMEAMLADGISTRRGVMASHVEAPYRELPRIELPETEWLCERSLTLPLFHEMTEEQQDHVVAALRKAIGA